MQLYKVGRDIGELKESVAALQVATSQIILLSKGTMVISGLTLAVSAASFVFLNQKLNKIDKRLAEIARDVKAIREFLHSQEKAALTTALKTLSGIEPVLEDKTRIPLLINARQTLGEIHERYRDQILNVARIQEVYGIEEYFSATALGHALCSAELDMRKNAISDLDEAFSTWQGAARRICLNLVMRKDPERFLFSAYAAEAKTAEIVDWLDFAHGTEKGIEWVDDLRASASTVRLPHFSLDESEKQGIEIMRKLVARNRIFEWYVSQYRFLEAINARPSNVQKYFETLKKEDKVEDCFLFVAAA